MGVSEAYPYPVKPAAMVTRKKKRVSWSDDRGGFLSSSSDGENIPNEANSYQMLIIKCCKRLLVVQKKWCTSFEILFTFP